MSPLGSATAPWAKPLAWAALVSVLFLTWAKAVSAKAEADSPYTLAQTFSGALRLLRVDLALEVTEKDADAAYLLFRYRLIEDPKRVVDGAIELVSVSNRVRVIVKIPQLSESHERLLRDRLMKKLRDDYGEPPRRAEPQKPSGDKPDKPDKPSGDKPDKPDKAEKP